MGTIAYMSPEQARGENLDVRTDLFSFGAVLYEMATGKSAFAGTTTALIHDAILNRQPASPLESNPQLPPKLAEIISSALEKDRDLRCQGAGELRAELKRLRRDTTSGRVVAAPRSGVLRSKRKVILSIAAAAVVVGVLVLLLNWWPFRGGAARAPGAGKAPSCGAAGPASPGKGRTPAGLAPCPCQPGACCLSPCPRRPRRSAPGVARELSPASSPWALFAAWRRDGLPSRDAVPPSRGPRTRRSPGVPAD